MESLKELNEICQKPRYKEVGNWMVRHIVRDAALPVTWLLLHVPITANQVTLVSLIAALLGTFCLAVPGNSMFLLSTALLQLWYLLDHVDGQIARYRKTASLTGRFFDFLTHHIVHGVLFFALGIYGFVVTHSFVFVLWGFFTSMSMMIFNLSHDVKYKTFFEKILSLPKLTIKPQVTALREKNEEEKQQKEVALLRKGFSFLHKLCEIHVLINFLTLMAIVQFFVPLLGIDFRFVSHLVYGIMVPVLAITKVSYLITKQQIDKEFNSLFSPE